MNTNRERTSGRQQGQGTRRVGKAHQSRRRFLKTALGWAADHAAGGVIQQAVIMGGASLLRSATSPVPQNTILQPGTGSVALLEGTARLEIHATATLV